MPDSLLIFAPLLVLAVVLLLGFAGCREILDIEDPVLVERILTFRARVPTSLTVVSPPGVRFIWTRPDATMEEAADVTASVQEGVDNVYAHEIPGIAGAAPDPGIWFGRCEMTARAGNRSASDASPAFQFTVPNTSGEYVLLFATTGSPNPPPPFSVEAVGLDQD